MLGVLFIKFKILITIVLSLFLIMSISCINAQDFNETEISHSDSNILKYSNDEIQSSHNEDILNDGDGSLSEFKNLISESPTNSEIKLTKNYTYNPQLDSGGHIPADGISINKKITIDGQGHTINFMNKVRAFRITGENVTLKNLVITNANFTQKSSSGTNLGLINWEGVNGTVCNVTFFRNYGDYGMIYLPDNGIKNDYLNVINSTFRENKGSYGSGIYSLFRGLKVNNTKFLGNILNYDGASGVFVKSDRVYGAIIENSIFMYNRKIISGNGWYGPAVMVRVDKERLKDSFLMSGCEFFYNNNGDSNVNSATDFYIDLGGINSTARVSNCVVLKEKIGLNYLERYNQNNISFTFNFNEQTKKYVRYTGASLAEVIETNVSIISQSDLPPNKDYVIYSVYNLPFTLVIYDDDGNVIKTIKNYTNLNGKVFYYYYNELDPESYRFIWYNDMYPFINYTNHLLYYETVQLELKCDNVTWKEIAKLNITFQKGLTKGTIKIYSGTVLYKTITLNNNQPGNRVVEFPPNNPGKYDITVEVTSGFSYFISTTKSITRFVTKVTPIINVTVVNIPNGVKIKVNSTNVSQFQQIRIIVDGNISLINSNDEITIDYLSAGIHEIIVQYLEGSQYYGFFKNFTVNITKQANFTVDIVGNNVVVTFSETLTGFILMDFNGDYSSWTNVLNSPIIVPLPENLPSGTNNFNLNYMGDENHPPIVLTKVFNIDKYNATLELFAGNITVGDNEVIKIILPKSATGSIILDITNHLPVTLTVSDSNILFYEIKNLNFGNYRVNATYSGDTKYNSAFNSTFFSVKDDRINSTPSISFDDENMDLNFPDDANGYVIIDINGTKYYAPVNNGTVNFTMPKNIPPGKYNVTVSYSGDDKYKNVSFTQEMTVDDEKTNPKIGFELKDGELNVTLPADASGYVIVDINGTKYHVPVENGKVNFTIPDNLKPGTYNLTVEYSGDDKYGSSKNSTSISVSDDKTKPKIGFELKDGELNVTLPADASGYVIVDINGTKYHVPIENGKANFTIPDNLAPGTYNVTVTYSGDDKYGSAKNSTSISVLDEKIDPVLDVKFNNSKFDIQLPMDASGYVVVDINGTKYPLLVDGGKCNLTLPKDLKPGVYDVVVDYAGDGKYSSKRNITQITIDAWEELVVGIDLENGNAKISLPGDAAGYVIVDINGTKYHVPIENGKANFSVPNNLEPGLYNLTVTYSGDDKYGSAKNSTTFRIADERIEPKLDVKINDAKLDVQLPMDATGYVVVGINGTKYPLLVNNGKCNMTLPKDLKPGVYDVVVDYAGDVKYASKRNITQITIGAQEELVIGIDLKNGAAKITLPNDATGYVVAEINGTKYHVPIENGKANFTIPDNLAPGTYNLTVTYSGDDKYGSSKNSTLIEILDKKTTVPVKIENMGDKIKVTLPNDAQGYAVADIDGIEVYKPIIGGSAELEIPTYLPKGNYTVTVTYLGDDKYASGFNLTNITVDGDNEKIATILSFEHVDNNLTVTGVLKDINGNVLKNKNVTYYINNENKGNIVTDNMGLFKLQTVSHSTINVVYGGDHVFKHSNATLVLDSFLDMRNLTKIVSEEYNTYAVDFDLGERGGYFKFRIVDGNGKALANKPVQIGFCGVVYNRVTDSEGYAQLQINLNTPFIFTFAIAFLGDETNNASFVVQQINVAKKTTSISADSKNFKASEKTKKFTVTLKSDKCASIDGNSYLGMGKKITLKVNGKTYTAKTNMRNQAIFKLDITKKGNYNAEIRFEGDQRYAASKTTAKIKIN